MNSQKGFSHAIIIIIIVVALIGALGFVFWNSFAKKSEQANSNTQAPNTSNTDNEPAAKVSTFKNSYSSVGESGFEFRYPDNWTLLPSPRVTESEDGSKKFVTTMLFSQKPTTDGKIEVASDHIVITFTELAGDHPFDFKNPGKQKFESKFKIGDGTVGLTAVGDGSSKLPFTSQLLSIDPISTHGESYVTLNNDYFLLATAQSNSYLAENATDRSLKKDIEEAKEILKSVKVINL